MSNQNNHATQLHCVKCAKPSIVKQSEKAFECGSCGFVHFHNVAAAVGAIIVHNHQLLLVERAQAPGKGQLDLPGGFVDYNESNEQALRRELKEELQLPDGQMHYLFSHPNQYLYKDVLYFTVDSFFEMTLSAKPKLVLQKQEISDYQWCDLKDIDIAHMAFDSGKRALADYLTIKKA